MDVGFLKDKIIIFDLDGTLADIKHRRCFVENGNREWSLFFKACVYDSPIQTTINLLNMFKLFTPMRIYILSGRRNDVNDETIEWLKRNDVLYDKIIMREKGDYTPDEVLKKKWLDEIGKENIFCVFDDRKRVVDMWRKEGIQCYQVADGDF